MKKVINTDGYETSEGKVVQYTLPSGKYLYSTVGSIIDIILKNNEMERKIVRYFGACKFNNINFLRPQ